MTIRFGPHFPSGNRRGQVQLFIENNVDRDNDFYTSAVSKVSGNHVIVRVDFHPSPSDPQHHMTGDVFIKNRQIGTAHVYGNGQVVMWPNGTD
ncbi:hypothetical protein C8Q70DRAFT_1053280 [Cubamyces menziesii]|nr:hypothetical protein C8Q70DRAFT_1053280 [Cubamyces menziesii]